MMKDRIRRLRLARGMTLQQVATHFGITSASVSSWEKGASIPDGRKLTRLADVLGTSVQYLVDGTELNLSAEQPRREPSGRSLALPAVPFVPWELLGTTLPLGHALQHVPALHSAPGDGAFATRYPGGATGIDWMPGRLPAGALILVDPQKSSVEPDLALLLDRTGRPFVGSAVNEVSAEGTRFRDYAAGTLHSGCVVVGGVVEWRISSII